MSKECKRFEENFTKIQNRQFSIMVNSGSSANLLLIQSLLNLEGLKKGKNCSIRINLANKYYANYAIRINTCTCRL